MAALLMQGVVSRGERRKAMKKKEDKKDDREERGIRKGGKERWWCVCCFQGLKGEGQQRIKATKALPPKAYG